MPQPARPRNNDNQPVPPLEGGVGASDADSGGGAGSGTPDGDTASRAGDKVSGGSVDRDRKKLFPDAESGAPAGQDRNHPSKE